MWHGVEIYYKIARSLANCGYRAIWTWIIYTLFEMNFKKMTFFLKKIYFIFYVLVETPKSGGKKLFY